MRYQTVVDPYYDILRIVLAQWDDRWVVTREVGGGDRVGYHLALFKTDGGPNHDRSGVWMGTHSGAPYATYDRSHGAPYATYDRSQRWKKDEGNQEGKWWWFLETTLPDHTQLGRMVRSNLLPNIQRSEMKGVYGGPQPGHLLLDGSELEALSLLGVPHPAWSEEEVFQQWVQTLDLAEPG